MDESSGLQPRICELFRECVSLVTEKCSEQRPGTVTKVTAESGVEIKEYSLNGHIEEIQSTQPFRELVTLITSRLGFQSLSGRIPDAIKASIFCTVDERKWYEATDSAISRSCKELCWCLSVQPYSLKVSAPMYWLNIGIPESIQLGRGFTLRGVNSFDRDNARKNQITSQDSLEEYGAILEKIVQTDYSPSYLYEMRETSLAAEEEFIIMTSCLRVFTEGLAHVRFIVTDTVGEYAAGITEQSAGSGEPFICAMSSRLVGTPELAVYGGVGRPKPRHVLISGKRLMDIPHIIDRYLRAISKDSFRRAVRRFERALMSSSPEDVFTDLVLFLESLLGGSTAEACHRAASLAGSSVENRSKVYDFLSLVYTQRNPIMHGSKGFGKEFDKKLKAAYGETCDLSWFLEQFTSLVRHCIRLAVLSEGYLGRNWTRSLIDNLLQRTDNSNLVKWIPKWIESQMSGWPRAS